MFRSSHFLFLVTFWEEVTKIRKHCVICVYILKGKMGKTEENRKKITQLKWPKNQKRQYGMNHRELILVLYGWTNQYIQIYHKGSVITLPCLSADHQFGWKTWVVSKWGNFFFFRTFFHINGQIHSFLNISGSFFLPWRAISKKFSLHAYSSLFIL